MIKRRCIIFGAANPKTLDVTFLYWRYELSPSGSPEKAQLWLGGHADVLIDEYDLFTFSFEDLIDVSPEDIDTDEQEDGTASASTTLSFSGSSASGSSESSAFLPRDENGSPFNSWFTGADSIKLKVLSGSFQYVSGVFIALDAAGEASSEYNGYPGETYGGESALGSYSIGYSGSDSGSLFMQAFAEFDQKSDSDSVSDSLITFVPGSYSITVSAGTSASASLSDDYEVPYEDTADQTASANSSFSGTAELNIWQFFIDYAYFAYENGIYYVGVDRLTEPLAADEGLELAVIERINYTIDREGVVTEVTEDFESETLCGAERVSTGLVNFNKGSVFIVDEPSALAALGASDPVEVETDSERSLVADVSTCTLGGATAEPVILTNPIPEDAQVLDVIAYII